MRPGTAGIAPPRLRLHPLALAATLALLATAPVLLLRPHLTLFGSPTDDVSDYFLNCSHGHATTTTTHASDTATRDPLVVVEYPTLDELTKVAGVAVETLKIYRYPVPKSLSSLVYATERCACKREYFRAEQDLVKLMPTSVWTDDPEQANFFWVKHLGFRV